MADTSEYPSRMQNGSDRMRRFFSFFGIRSARMERERSDDE
ncbi:hypothetical protein ACNO8S_16415 (plasmid) [Haloarcula sp. KBTZ06]